ncbi:MAG TPA: hypothetical protein VFZ34_16780 [Blastocatellia bacterium]|nr:hypothetical protein [Blastocatellia bacterium]
MLSQGALDRTTLAAAEASAEQAANLAPFQAKHQLLLAAIKGATGDLTAQENHLRAALILAPHNIQVRWRLANALLRAGKKDESLAEFRRVVTAAPALLPNTLDMLWQWTEGDVETLVQATGEAVKNRLQLAQFLLKQTRVDDAVRIIGTVDRRMAAPEVGGVLQELMAAGKFELAHKLWLEQVGTTATPPALLWNGSFEDATPPHLTQFEWQLRSSEYAQLAIDPYVARTGAKSLRLDFLGRDTTRLSNEIKQMIILRPGRRYRLTCYVRTTRLITPQGPRVAVMAVEAARVLATTNPITAEATDWQPLSLEFTAPANTSVLWVNVQRSPQTDYDDPTQGTIWFDDFTVTELPS